MKKLIKILIISLLALPIMSCAVVHHYGAYYGKVVDAETKEPLEGAAVVAVYKTQQYGFAGPIARFADAQETVTDKNGEFKIPSKTIFTFRPLQSFDSYAWFTIFRPVYGCYPKHKGVKQLSLSKGILPPNKHVTIELPKLKTRDERLENTSCFPVGVPDEKMRKLIEINNIERIDLGLKPTHTQEDEK